MHGSFKTLYCDTYCESAHTYGEGNISHENTTMVVWIYDGV